MTANETKSKKKDSDSKNINYLKKEIQNLKTNIKEKEDKLLRSYADLQNYQKRMQKELKINEDELKKKYLSEILDLKELLEKAMNDENPKEGLNLLLKNINIFLEKEEIKCIDCVGKKFDHNIHHAITTINKDSCEDDTIIEELKKGYMICDKLLRPSHVIVAKNNENKKE